MNRVQRISHALNLSRWRSPLPRPLRFLAPPLAAIFTAIVRKRNRYWEGHAAARVARPVVSVGNLSVGGTGKTPVVSWLAAQCLAAGVRPAIVMRGYKARGGHKSDEQIEHERRLPDVPVIANPDRRAGIERHLASNGDVDLFILDDGFQHRQLHRDLDIVLVDALRSPFDDAVLPRGYLREPVASLARADVVALTRVNLVSDDSLMMLRSEISQIVGEPPQVEFRSIWTHIDSTDAAEPREVEWLRDRSLLPVCGIGRPEAFLRMAERAGVKMKDCALLKDHAAYDEHILADLVPRAAGGDGILTTAKDWVKIEPLLRGRPHPVAVHRPRLEFELDAGGESLLERVVGLVRQQSERR